LGCARNLVDSEEMLGRLKQAGWQICAEPEEAQAIVVNTCSFIRAAAEESIDTILELAKFKERGSCRCLIVAGCLPERYREELAVELPEVDYFLGTGAYDRIVDALAGRVTARRDPALPPRCLLPDPDTITALASESGRVLTYSHTAYLKIAEGCSCHCTYCIIPKLRGKQKSRPAQDILREAETLLVSGVRELVLVAQDSTAYGRDRNNGTHLAELLEKLSDMAKDAWIRVLYGHPESIDTDIIRILAERENLCSYYDLPVQHISDRVLKNMGRRSTQKELFRLFESIRSMDAQASLRTTVIVGFPGETEADFKELMGFIETVQFDHLGVFTYSDAEDLPSHRLSDPVPEKIAQDRYDRLMECQMKISEINNEKYLDRTLSVLIEQMDEPQLAEGRAMFQAPEVDGLVFVNHEKPLNPGDFVSVRITDTLEYDLIGQAL
jgi:ribosomal protein S12 methylthiotransferase